MLITQRQAVRKGYDRYLENLSRPLGLYGTDTGHHALNMITGGHVATKITTLAARSSIGKTGLITQMINSAGVVRDGKRTEILFYSWECEASFIADRHVCWKTGLTLSELRYARVLPQAVRDKIMEAYDEANKFPITYHSHSIAIDEVLKINKEWLGDTAKKASIEGVKVQPVMVLDFIGMSAGATKYSNRTYDLGDFLQKLKQHANDTGLAVVILAQINRTADSKEHPDVTDLSDSQFIEQNSDTVVIMDRPEHRKVQIIKDPITGADIPSGGKAVLRTVKNREGMTGDCLINCDISKFRFWSRDMDFGQDYNKLYKDENFWKTQGR